MVSGESRLVSGDNFRVEKEDAMGLISFGLFALRPVITGRALAPLWEVKDGVRCTVMTDEDEAEVGLEPWRECGGGFGRVEAITDIKPLVLL